MPWNMIGPTCDAELSYPEYEWALRTAAATGVEDGPEKTDGDPNLGGVLSAYAYYPPQLAAAIGAAVESAMAAGKLPAHCREDALREFVTVGPAGAVERDESAGSYSFNPYDFAATEQWERWSDADGVCLERTARGYALSVCMSFDSARIEETDAHGAPVEVLSHGVTIETLHFRETVNSVAIAAIVLVLAEDGKPVYARTPELRAELVGLLGRIATPTGGTSYGSELAARVATGPAPWEAPKAPALFAGEPKPPGRRRSPAMAPLDTGHAGFMLAPANRIHKATVESLAPGAMQRTDDDTLSDAFLRSYGLLPGETFWAAYCFDGNEKKATGAPDTIRGIVGFPKEPEAALWELLQRNGPLAVKAHYALWATAYAETDARIGVWIKMDLPTFCDRIGYARKKGAHRRENKLQAVDILQLLTSIELIGTYTEPKTGGKVHAKRVRSVIWSRGAVGEEYDGYADLFGQAREGSPALWDPVAFAYAPGPVFYDPSWHRYNQNVALVGTGLLRLDTGAGRDKWAIMLGGYLAALIRMDAYTPRACRVATLLARSGMARADRRYPGRLREAFERALDRLAEVRVIGGWEFTGTDASEPDMDEPEELATLADASADDWRRKSILVRWPDDLGARAAELTRRREAKREEEARLVLAEAERKRLPGR